MAKEVVMTEQDKAILLAGAKMVFFKAMLSHFGMVADKAIGVTARQETGGRSYRKIVLQIGNHIVIDEFWLGHDFCLSSGNVTISLGELPLWRMYFHGTYPKEAQLFLDEAVVTAYKLGEFWGGRGPYRFRVGGYTYYNSAELGSFDRFEGREHIDANNARIGQVSFGGGSLL